MFVLKILRDGGRVKRLKAKKGCSEANGKGSVPASRTARFWRCWTWLFFIFPIDAATVHSEAQETPLWLGASRIEGNPWAPKNPPVDVKLVRWIKRQNVVFAQRSFWWKSVVSHCSSQPRSCHNLLGGGWQHWFGPARKAGLTAGETCIMAHDGHCMPLLWLFCTLKTSPFFWRPSPQHTRKTDLTRWMARVFATHRNSVSGQQLIRHLDAIERLMLEASTSIRFRSGFLEKSWN